MQLFKRTLTFRSPDPLGDGLAEAIRAEQQEAARHGFEDNFDGDELAESWQRALDDLKNDPDWFDLLATE